MPTNGTNPPTPAPLRLLRRRLSLLLLIYFFAGSASQKLIPGVDEIFPFFGWSLFSKVPNVDQRYDLLLEPQGSSGETAISFFHAPGNLVTGNRYIGRKVIQKLGKALDRGEAERALELRTQLEQAYLLGKPRYHLVFESYHPLEKWRTGENRERRQVATFQYGEPDAR
ncbi:MAG: hypothetical protein K0U98_00695 [Deltaproteobacteria bacterium]|nr:hypothetical protein [Deltaproteobacteria bacterium]